MPTQSLIQAVRALARSAEPAPLAFMAVAAAGMIAYFSIPDATVQAVLISAVSLATPVAVAIGIRHWRPVAARYWWLLVLGLAGNGIGTTIDWMSWIVADGVGIPSVADVFYLGGYLLTFLGLLLLVHRHTGNGARTASIDSGIMSTAIGTIVWVLLVQPVAHGGELDAAAFAVTAAYPILDVAMLGLAATILLQPTARPPVVRFMLIALVATYLSDIAWTYVSSTGEYVDASLVDVGWWVGPIFWGAAGLHTSMARFGDAERYPAAPVTRWRLLALGVAITVVPVLLIVRGSQLEQVDIVMIEAAAILLGWMVVLRLGATLDDLAHSLARRIELQGELYHQAAHDPLTGLVNRLAFTERLGQVLGAGVTRPGVLLLDLDDFKAVNDSHGHQVGDTLLVQVAGRLRESLRGGDLAARLGGDEFAILLENCATEQAARDVAGRLLDTLEAPFDVAGHMVFSRGSIGIALPGDRATDADELLRDADIAMYLAKGQGKGRLEVYQPTMHASILGRIALRADLQEAIAANQFVLHYQPIFSIRGGRLMGLEALVRWQHPGRGLVAPNDFIGLAEETGLIVPLGRWVLGEACRQLAAWQALGRGTESLSMTVNVSGVQLQHPAFVDHLREALAEAGIPAASLVLELTESVLHDTDASVRVLEALKAIGVRIAIDDFGTGYSSLSYVGRFPIDILKIDRSFVAALGGSSKEAALTATIVDLAQNLSVTTIAEGIEDAVQLRVLKGMGCDMGQGFFLARPLQASLIGPLILRESDRAVDSPAVTAGTGRHAVAVRPGSSGSAAGS